MKFAIIIWTILVLTSTFYLKRFVISSLELTDTVECPLGTMSGAKGRYQPSNTRGGNLLSEPKFKGGTPGFEYVVFTYGKGMKQGDRKEHLQSLSGIATSSTKYGGARLTWDIRKMGFEDNPEPEEPDEKAKTLVTKKYKRACKKWVKVEEEMEENNKNAYEIILKTCYPSMKMKLKSTANFQRIEDEQDSMDFLKLLHSLYFQHDGAKQNIM